MQVSYNGYYTALPRQICGFDSHYLLQIFSGGAKVAQAAVNRGIVGSNPTPRANVLNKTIKDSKWPDQVPALENSNSGGVQVTDDNT